MTRILLINPNSTQATTDMMVAIARTAATADVEIVGETARRSPPTIVEPAALAASAAEVVTIGARCADSVSGIMVAAFGDPGLAALRTRCRVPVVGIAEASMLTAARGGRRFGVATTTPALADAISARAVALGVGPLYAGIRLTPGDPLVLMSDPDRLLQALGEAVRACIELDAADAVIIGGGPLGHAATALAARFTVPVIAPIPAAVHRLMGLLEKS